MRGFKRLQFVLLGSVLAAALVGCSSKTPEEESYDLLEEVASIEQAYEKQHEPLQKLEAEDNEIYAQIIKLGMKEMDEVKTLSNEAINGIKEREELMKKEKKSIDEARERFGDFDALREDLSEKKVQTEAAELQKIMNKRYEDYDQLYDLYLASLAEEKKLYELFKDEKATKKQFEEQIERVNKTYTELSEVNVQFNEQTDKYNEKKISFYHLAEIDVVNEQP